MDRSSSRRAGAKWRRRRGLAVLVALGGLLAGCASAPIQAPVASMAPPSGGTARIVVIRPEKGLPQLMDVSFNVKLDGVSMGDVLTGTIIAADRPAGPHQLTADLWGNISL